MEATSKSLFQSLARQIEKLDKRQITVDEAKAHATLSKQANNILRYELDRAKAIAKHGDELKIREIEDQP